MNRAVSCPTRPRPGAAAIGRGQEGIVLFIALIILVAMSLSGIALLRQTTADVVVAGNLTFKQTATLATDRGIAEAMKWLKSQADGVALENDRLSEGYYSSWDLNLATQSWDDSHSVLVGGLTNDGYGNEIRYIVHRLCPNANKSVNDQPTGCTTLSALDAQQGNSQAGPSYGSVAPQGSLRPYYRVTVRAAGPRNTLSYAQAIVR